MLRRFTTLSFLTATLLLTACQNFYSDPNRTNVTDADTATTNDGQVGFGSDNALEYNQWQWNYFSKLSKDVPNNYDPSTPTGSVSTSQFVSEKELKTTDGNVWDFSTEKNIPRKQRWENLAGAKSKQCVAGRNQSPINITRAIVPLDGGRSYGLRYHYQPQDFLVQDNGHSIVYTAKKPTKSAISIKGKVFYLINLQYRAISEHAIMGVHLPLELQLTHVAEDGEMVVISVMVNIGAGNRAIQRLTTSLPSVDNPRAVNTLAKFNVGKLIPNYGFYAYNGSITVPPCTENVKWLVASKALTANANQIYKFEAKYSGNMRGLRPQGNRTVYLIK
ncbi:MAG: carbonic anhydrase family protein [Moraxellaceae bacterium]|nr:carbonic anhydrase family protein [Moraxellaceae bacterium]